jgi:predicted nuclease of restriction endonuclease-like (RecB) superfamily
MKKNTIVQNDNQTPKEYAQFLEHIKTDVLQTQLKAALAITQELTLLYWRIGKSLSEKTQSEGWGAKVVEELARDIRSAFPDVAGFSLRNLQYMRTFAEAYPDANCAAAAAQIPWGHTMVLLDKLQNNDQMP